MIERFYTDPRTLARLHGGPLRPHIDTFAALLSELGYARVTIRCQLRLVGDLSHWLEDRGLEIEALDESTIARSLEDSPRGQDFLGSHKAVLRRLLAHLRNLKLVPPASPRANDGAMGQALQDYGRYLEHERGLSPVTLGIYLPAVRRFLEERFERGSIQWSEVMPADVATFLSRQAQSYSHGQVKLMVTALRSFFRFLHWRGDIPTNLAAAVPNVAQWRLSTVPKSLEPEQVERLLESCDLDTLVGQRDYAILLLIARLGLRAGEVVAMRLEDLDWRAGELIVRGKGARRDRLPIPKDVGDALVSYLRQRHPKTSSRRVFIRVRAPYREFAKAGSISIIVARALARAGIDSARRGAHLLRHSLAREMLRKGASLAEIGQILRHSSPSTTEIYAKVDLAALRELAPPWPGGAS